MGIVTDLASSVVDLVGQFAQVATGGPIVGLLLLVGAVLTAAAALVFGYLALAGVVAAIVPESSGGRPQRAR